MSDNLDALPNEHINWRQLPMAPTDSPPNDVSRGTPQALPTVDDLLGKAPPLPTVDELLGQGPPPSVMDVLKNQAMAPVRSAGRILPAWLGTEPFGFSADQEETLKRNGIFNDAAKGQNSIIRTINEAVLHPAAAAADAAWRGLTGIPSGIAQVARELGAPELLARDIAGEAERRLTTGSPEGGVGFHPNELAPYKIGPDEGAYMGTSEPRPAATPEAEAATVKDAVERAKAGEPPQPTYAPGALGPQPTEGAIQPYAPTRDIHQVARTLDPQTFDEYDSLEAKRDELRSNLTAERQKLQENAEAQAPNHAEIQDLEQRLESGTTPRLAKKYEERLEAMRPAHDEFMQSDQFAMLTRDTDEMAQMRQELQQSDYRMRDLAPQVSAAYREASQQFPEPTAEAAPAVSSEQPAPPPLSVSDAEATEVAQPPASTPEATPQPTPVQARLAQASEAEAQLSREAEQPRVVSNIADDVTQKLVAAGRPQEEAQAAAAVVQAHYETRAADFGGAKGSAEEMYSRDAPDIRGGGVGGREGRATGKTFLNDGRAVITLFQKADASTFVHETGHAWLEEMLSDAFDPVATADMKARAQTVREWLGAKADEPIKTAQHEKFARGFERYLMEGTAPTRALDGVFAQFKNWLTKIYQTVAKLKAPITDDIRDVFDRLLSREPEPAIMAPERASEVAPARPGVMPKIRTIQEIMAGDGVSAARARRVQEQEILARSQYTGAAPEHAPEVKITSDLAALHETDATETPAEHAAAVADQIRTEREETARTHAPEVTGGPTGGTEAEAGGGPGGGGPLRRPGGGEPTAGELGGRAPEPEAVGASRGEAAAESNRPPPEPTFTGDTYAGPAPRYLDKAGNIRLELLTDDMSARAALHEIAERNGDFMTARRGVVSDPQVLDLADAINASVGDVNIKRLAKMSIEDDVPMAARILAGRKMLLQSVQAVRDTVSENDIEGFIQASDRLNMIQATVSGITAEWGRAGRAFRQMAPEAKEAKDMAAIVQEATGRTLFQIQKQMKLAANLNTPAQIAKFTRDSAKRGLFDWIESAWTTTLLSGPQTHATYSIANQVLALFRAVPQAGAAAAIGTLRRAFGADAADAAHFGEIPRQLYGWYRGSLNGAKAAVTAAKTNEPVLPPEAAGLSGLTGAPASLHANIPNPQIGGVTIPIGTTFELPGRMVNTFHTFNFTTFYYQGISAIAYREATAEGLVGDAFTNRLAYLETNPTESMVREATQLGAAGSLMTRPAYGSAMQKLGSIINTGKTFGDVAGFPLGTFRPLKYVDPFIQVAATLQKAAFGRATPLGLFSQAVRDDLMFRNGGAAFDRTAGAMLAGTTFMTGAGFLAAQGLLNRGGPDDPKQTAGWRAVNGLPYGLRIGELSVDVRRFGVLGMQAAMAADLYHAVEHLGKGEVSAFAGQAVEALKANFLEEGVLRGFSDIFRAVDDTRGSYQGQYLRNLGASFIPFSVGMSQIARDIDPYQRQARTLLDTMLRKVPFDSETLRPRYDVWGQPVPNEGWAGASYVHLANDPTEKVLQNLDHYPALPKRDILGVKLTDQQYDDFTMVRGRIAKKLLDAMVATPGFTAQSQGAQLAQIKGRMDAASEKARALIIYRSAGTDNDIARLARDKKRALFQKPVASSDEGE